MKAVQTLWTRGQSLLADGFGWAHPQYNLMSWALSSLCLSEHFNEVVLYTDSIGYEMLVKKLGLPYTDVVIQYDHFTCPPPHWAYAKVMTYSLQKEPFIHVDGDVYLPHPLRKEIETANLIAQNEEVGSGYYRKMMDNIMEQKLMFPDFLKKEIESSRRKTK